MHHDHTELDHASMPTLGLCALVPYLLGFDPTGHLVAVATDDRTSAWPCDPATTSPAELAYSMAHATNEGWWPCSEMVLLAYRPVPSGLLAEAVDVFTDADCSIWDAWTVDAGNGLVYPCQGCDDDPVPYNRSATAAAVLTTEDTARSGAARRALRDRLEPISTGDVTTFPDRDPEEAGALLRRVLLGGDDPTPLDAITFSTALRFPDIVARAEAMTFRGQVTAARLLHLVRHTPVGCRANTACLLAIAAAQYPAPDSLLAVDAISIALDEAACEEESERCQRLSSSLYLPPVTTRHQHP